MNCDETLKNLKAFIEPRTGSGLPGEIATHLAACSSCRSALASIDPVAALLTALPVTKTPQGFKARLMDKARTRAARASSRRFTPASLPLRLAVAASVLVGVAMGLVLGVLSARSVMHGTAAKETDPVDVYCLSSPGSERDVSIAGSYLDMLSGSEVEAR